MILSGRDVRWYIEQQKLKIDPITDVQFQQNGVDFILETARVPEDKVIPTWLFGGKSNPRQFTRGEFYLGCTREYIEMPDDLMAFVALRSTWAREGLSFAGLTIIDAGFKGQITLEINASRNVRIPYGERFAHIVFSKLSSPSDPYQGKYQGQRGITEAIQDEDPAVQRAVTLSKKFIEQG